MADLPIEEKKEVLLTVEERLDLLATDVKELARGINTQGALLESIVTAFDSVIKTYLTLIGKYVPPTKTENKPNEKKDA